MNIETVLTWPSVREVRALYGYSNTWIYDLLSRGVLIGYQINDRWHIDPQSLKQFEERPRRWRKRTSKRVATLVQTIVRGLEANGD